MVTAAESLVACLTPAGSGAIAVLGLRGPHAWATVRELFHPRAGKLPDVPSPQEVFFGRLGVELQDEVIVRLVQHEPEPVVEVHCHGGPEVIRILLESFEQRGLRRCSSAEWYQAAGEDPLAAAARTALPHAPTIRTATILLDQMQGALTRTLDLIRRALDRARPEEATQLLSNLVRYAPLGRHLVQPWRIAVAGAPNVGKSSLVNALAGYQRSVVSPIPGTTRDVVTTMLALDGWPVELVDMAGLHETSDPLEQAGIARARDALQAADVCLWLVETTAPPIWPEGLTGKPLVLINKADVAPTWDLDQAGEALRVSARTGQGLDRLIAALVARLVPDVPPAGAAVPFTAALATAVTTAWEHLQAGRSADARNTLDDLAAGKGLDSYAAR